MDIPIWIIHPNRLERLRRAVRWLTLISIFWTAKSFIRIFTSAIVALWYVGVSEFLG